MFLLFPRASPIKDHTQRPLADPIKSGDTQRHHYSRVASEGSHTLKSGDSVDISSCSSLIPAYLIITFTNHIQSPMLGILMQLNKYTFLLLPLLDTFFPK